MLNMNSVKVNYVAVAVTLFVVVGMMTRMYYFKKVIKLEGVRFFVYILISVFCSIYVFVCYSMLQKLINILQVMVTVIMNEAVQNTTQ